MLLPLVMVIYHFISYLDRLFYSFSDGFLSDVRDNWNNDNVEVNNSVELYTNSASIFDHYFDDEVTQFLDCWLLR